MGLDPKILVSLHGSRLGLSRKGHFVQDGHIQLAAPSDRMARAELFDHFLGPTLSTFLWNVAHGSDGSAANPVINVQKGGVARAVTGAGATTTMAVNGTQICGALNFECDELSVGGAPVGGVLEFQTALKLSAITTTCVFVGWTNQTSALQMPGTISGGTLTAVANDFCGALFDTAATAATWKLVSAKGGTVNGIIDTGLAPVTTAFDHWGVELDSVGNAHFYHSGQLIGTQAAALTATAPLAPVVCGFRRAASSMNIDIDFLWAATDRHS